MCNNKTKWVGYFLPLMVVVSTMNTRSIASATTRQPDAHRKLLDISYVVSLVEDRHSELMDEFDAPRSESLSEPSTPDNMQPFGDVPIGDLLPECPEIFEGSFGDTATTENIEIPYKYEVRYKTDSIDGSDVVDSVMSAIEIALSNSIYSALFLNCGTDVNTRRTTVQGKNTIASGESLQQKISSRRLIEMIGMSADPNDTTTMDKCSFLTPECKVIEGALTVFISNSNAIDGGVMISNIISLIQNIFDSGSLLSAHPSILSLSFVNDDSSFSINDDGDDNFTEEKIEPDEDDGSSYAAVIISSVVGIFIVFGAAGTYLNIKGKKVDQNSENGDSINLYEEAVL